MLFAWVRRLFYGKSLEEHLAGIRKMQGSLREFSDRTRAQMEQKQCVIDALNVENQVHQSEIARADMVRDNFEKLMTEPMEQQHTYV